MPHPHLHAIPSDASATLGSGSAIAGSANSSAGPPDVQSPAARASQTIDPPPVTDQFGHDWKWTSQWGAYRHDTSSSTILRDPSDLWGNAFEWCWAHSRATSITREVLLALAWSYDRFPTGEDFTDPRPHWPGYAQIHAHAAEGVIQAIIEQAVIELVTLGELTLIATASNWSITDLNQVSPQVTYDFPSYQAWCQRETQGAGQ